MSYLATPRLQPLSSAALSDVRLLATDMDGTLTQQGKFTATLLQALTDLAKAGLQVLIVTGRSAGWVNGLVSYLPVAGAIAENGGLFYAAADPDDAPTLLVPIADPIAHRQALADAFRQLQAEFPQIRESSDNRFRITDWTFEIEGLSLEELQQLSDRCQTLDWGFTYSTIQCHIKPLQQDKAIGLDRVLQQHFPQYSRQQIATLGDSPNDESLFEADRFPCSVGVANIRHYVDQLMHQPAFVTQAAEVAGFCEVAALLTKRFPDPEIVH